VLHTLECLICSFIAIFVWMGQKTQFPICLFNLCICCRLFQGKDLIECCRIAFPYSYHRSLLLNCVFSVLVSLFMIPGIGCAIGRRFCARGRGGHSRVEDAKGQSIMDRRQDARRLDSDRITTIAWAGSVFAMGRSRV
jgi:hypothetical protein